MLDLPGEPSDVAGLSFASDHLVMNVHGDVDSAKDLTPESFKRVVDHFRASGFAKRSAR